MDVLKRNNSNHKRNLNAAVHRCFSFRFVSFWFLHTKNTMGNPWSN